MTRILVQSEGPVKTVTLNRPEKRNALDLAMLDDLYTVFSAAPAPDDRMIVIRARGPSFCAGIDLAERRRRPVQGSESPVERVFRAIEMNPLPVLAVVQGAAIAGGCEMALHCDLVVAAESARFGMSLAQIGLAPSWFLTRKLMDVAGPVATREILLLGDPMPAGWMHRHGIVARVVPDGDLETEVDRMVERLAANAPLSLRAMKAMIVRQLEFRDGIEHGDVDAMVAAARGSADAQEGMAARLEKRVPVFRGL